MIIDNVKRRIVVDGLNRRGFRCEEEADGIGRKIVCTPDTKFYSFAGNLIDRIIIHRTSVEIYGSGDNLLTMVWEFAPSEIWHIIKVFK